MVDEQPYFVNYAVICSDGWTTREAHVHVTNGGSTRMARLHRSEEGSWRVDGRDRSDLHGITDLDIQWTPSTNALPVNRLRLAVGESREVTAAWVRLPDLVVEPLVQRYTRIGEQAYRYESGPGRFMAEVTVDGAGFVERYGEIWQCVARA